MNIIEDLYYTESHEWVRLDSGIATVGISDFAQREMGDIVFVELPEVGMKVAAGEPCGSIEAVKAVEDMLSPLSGKVVERNTDLEDTPELMNSSPYEDGWIMKIRISDKDELDNLLSAAEYKKIIPE